MLSDEVSYLGLVEIINSTIRGILIAHPAQDTEIVKARQEIFQQVLQEILQEAVRTALFNILEEEVTAFIFNSPEAVGVQGPGNETPKRLVIINDQHNGGSRVLSLLQFHTHASGIDFLSHREMQRETFPVKGAIIAYRA